MKILALTEHNPRRSFHPEEDSYRYAIMKNRAVVSVADGITRDPSGIENFPSNPTKKMLAEIIKKHPYPSPAKIAADKFTLHSISQLQSGKKNLKEILSETNTEIKKLNEKNNSSPDYLQNDFWACVGVIGIVTAQNLHYGFLCDCGVCVFDKEGRLKFRTSDEGPNTKDEKIWKSPLLKEKTWNDTSARKIVRSLFRNNPNEPASYGAFTGEEKAKYFFRTGSFPLSGEEYVVFYSDGFADIIYSSDFKIAKRFPALKSYLRQNSKKINGSEGTLVAIHLAQ